MLTRLMITVLTDMKTLTPPTDGTGFEAPKQNGGVPQELFKVEVKIIVNV